MKQLLVIDFETAYSPEYGLKKFNYLEYVKDPRFEVIGVAVKVNDGPAEWFSGTDEATRQWLLQFDWAGSAVVAHNGHFDFFILCQHFGIFAGAYIDTLSMARPLHGTQVGGSLDKLVKHYNLGEKGNEVVQAIGKWRKDFSPSELRAYGEYCKNDVELTYKLLLALIGRTPNVEMKVIDAIMRMVCEPKLTLDVPMLKQALERLRKRKAQILDEVGISKEDLMSNAKFAGVLESLGVTPPTKYSLKVKDAEGNPKLSYAFAKTDPGMVELLEHEDERIQMIAAARIETKSTGREGRLEKLIIAGGLSDQLPFPLKYAGAHTNRYSGDWLWNLQNLPRHIDVKRGLREPLRDALIAPEGHSIIAIDSSQIEARVNAWLSGEEQLNELFAQGGDPYCAFAEEVYGRRITKADITERFVGKGCVLGLGFLMGHIKLQATLKKPMNGVSADLPLDECKRLVDTYRSKFKNIAGFWKECREAIYSMANGQEYSFGTGATIRVEGESLVLPSGMRLLYDGLQEEYDDNGRLNYSFINRETRTRTKIYNGKLCENIVQSVARDIISWQMVQAIKAGYDCVGMVHDELIFVVPDESLEDAFTELEGIMKKTPKWAKGCPVSCEGAYAKSYGET
jgi:DNA polymerase